MIFGKFRAKPDVPPAAPPAPPVRPVVSDLPKLEEADLIELNRPALEYMRSQGTDFFQKKLTEVTIDNPSPGFDVEAASRILDEEGIVAIPHFLSEDTLSLANDTIHHVSAALGKATQETNYEDDDVLVQSADYPLKTYAALRSHEKAVVNVRRGADEGMVDVFNIDRLSGDKRSELRAPFERSDILQLLSENGQTLEASNLNAYMNSGISKTRGLHVDSFKKTLKGFVYLTDVTSLDHGPYCFVRRSHKDNVWRKTNQTLSKMAAARTEAPFVDHDSLLPVMAPAGTLIISDQSGVHRGIPQAPDQIRQVLVMLYT
ncbi:MAG: hypothetical protein AAGE61_08180 [Pseudomonadota bacterium]